MQLFSIHLVAVESFYEMPSIAEATWHGACLACAELARRGLVPNNQLNELINWLTKVLIQLLYTRRLTRCPRLCILISVRVPTLLERA